MKKVIISMFILCAALVSSSAQDTKAERKMFGKKYIAETMQSVLKWQLAHPKYDVREWTNGAFYAGVYAAYETTGSKSIYKAMLDTFATVGWTPFKRWYHADDIAICQTYLDMYASERRPEMIKPLIDTLDKLIAQPYPVRGVEVIKWWWCDALFMAPPTLVKAGVITGKQEYLAKNDEYFKECYALLYNNDEHLFARDLNFVIKNDGNDRYESNGRKIFWSRGNGWVMGGLTRILKVLPADYPERPFYENLFREMAEKIASIQQADGLWRASLLDPDAYPGGEVSGSGFFCYALAYGINSGLLDRSYLKTVEKAWLGLNRCIGADGRMGWVQPVGVDPRKNFSADSWEVYGTGAFLLAGSEVVKLKR
ncbi:MAG: glycoside hydrolase family 88 protein [Tannerellaceae bacterium]|jgi:rhamnogalacturonyl hydrolase YesR|nr:glycoside hydrolase family 88 protein [Tannerellaceae bacterium]